MRGRVGIGSVRIGAACLGMLLAACALPGGTARADVAPSVMIVPGQSIGPVQLGMTAKAVTSVLGNPVPGDGGQIKFPRVAVTVTVEDSVVVRVSTTNPQFRTARGAGVGIGADDSARLIGDLNQTIAVAETETTISYPFQGIGFVFRGDRAVEVFVEQSIGRNPSLPPPLPVVAIPAFPSGDDLVPPAPPSDVAPSVDAQPPAQTGPTAQTGPPAQTAASLQESLVVQDLAEVVDGRGVLRITGTLANTGTQEAGPLALTARLYSVGGSAGGEASAPTAPKPLPPGGEMPFTLEGSVMRSVVTQYAVEVGVSSTPPIRFVIAHHTVSREAYADLARSWVKVSVQLGAPSNIGPRVQVLVSISGTGPMPLEWVRQVEVVIPFTGGSSTVTLTPGQTLTILVPSVAQVGQPQVQRVLLNAP